MSVYFVPLNYFLQLILVDWLDEKVVKATLYSYIVVLLCVVSRTAAV